MEFMIKERPKPMPWRLLPPREGVCPVCAVPHAGHEPHNKESLFYQMQFYAEHGRWATWDDAMAHCDEETRCQWMETLKSLGYLE